MLSYIKREHADIMKLLKEKQALDAQIEQKLNSALEAFAKQYEKLEG